MEAWRVTQADEREARALERAQQKEKDEHTLKLQEMNLKEREITLKERQFEQREYRSVKDSFSSRPSDDMNIRIKLPKFQEGQDIEIFLRSFENLSKAHGWERYLGC